MLGNRPELDQHWRDAGIKSLDMHPSLGACHIKGHGRFTLSGKFSLASVKEYIASTIHIMLVQQPLLDM